MTEKILGSLRAQDGAGVVRIEHRYDASISDVWSAITEPDRIAGWHGKVTGNLRAGGSYRIYLAADDWEGGGRIEVCDPPHRLVITSRESDESARKGKGAAPFDEVTEVTLTADGDQTVLVAEIRGLPLDKIEFYGVGWQIHAENLATCLAGRERGDTEPRWDALLPSYQEQAAGIR